jgi:hypothetical protein
MTIDNDQYKTLMRGLPHNNKFSYGKHEGKSFEEVFNEMENRGYIRWLCTYDKPLTRVLHKDREALKRWVADKALEVNAENPKIEEIRTLRDEELLDLLIPEDVVRPVLDESGEYRFMFGKYKGTLVSEVVKEDRDYIDWLIETNSKVVNAYLKDPEGYVPDRKSYGVYCVAKFLKEQQ